MSRILKTAITSNPTLDMSSIIAGNPATASPPYMPVRLYIPVESHSITFSENPAPPIIGTFSSPVGILPHNSAGHSNSYAATSANPPTDYPTTSTSNTDSNGFRNVFHSQGTWELTLALQGTLQRLIVGIHLPVDATDARGYRIAGNPNYLISGAFDTTIYDYNNPATWGDVQFGMTGDQLRNELLFLAARQNEFGSQESGARNPLYYMYPYWRGRMSYSLSGNTYSVVRAEETPHFFRGFIRTISVNDEVGPREAYKFTMTFNIVNQRPI